MNPRLTIISGLILAILIAMSATAASTDNPLDQLKEEVKIVLEEAKLPFTTEQEQAIVLMMEDRRKASEDLFGDLMNFKAGPTQGQEADRLRSAIDWMRNDFLGRLKDYLTPEQVSAWAQSQETAEPSPTKAVDRDQTQFVRINNNPFTAEDAGYRFRGGGGNNDNNNGPEVIQRGGVGKFHGNAQLLLKDESLNAGRRFAANKPTYQERQTSFDFGGPVIPGRLTTSFEFRQREAENVEIVRATLLEGVFAEGITRPSVNRSVDLRNTYQLSDSNSLSFNLGYSTNSNRNQGVGGFVLPERASSSNGNDWNVELRQFSALSPRSIYETRFNVRSNHDETTPITEALRINVPDAFSSGGAQNRADNTGRSYEFSNLYTRLAEKGALKAGLLAIHRRNHSLSENNFLGTFTFSSLDAYREGLPINYRVNRGNPVTETNQWEFGYFLQNDLKITPRLTLMYGVRHEFQTNINDRNNIDPRVGLAFGVGRNAVIRAGAGIFHQRLAFNIIEAQRRADGTRQYEIVIDNPSYPDPFQSGTIRNSTQSVWVTDPNFKTPYTLAFMLSYERTFLNNLFFSATYDRSHEVHRARLRNLNAPMDITAATPQSCKLGQSKETCVRPFPDRGNILNLESSGGEVGNTLRLNVRQRFSIFNVSANYTLNSTWLDSNMAGAFGNANVIAGLGQDGMNSDNYNLKSDWAQILAPVHTVYSTVNARLPMGIFLTETMSWNSGRHYTITTGKDDNLDSSVNDRPAGAKRNGENGPKFLAFNFNISKAFFFGEAQGSSGKNVNLFANMTNALNRPNYNPPSGVMSSPNFGKSTSAGAPREIEVGLRFQF